MEKFALVLLRDDKSAEMFCTYLKGNQNVVSAQQMSAEEFDSFKLREKIDRLEGLINQIQSSTNDDYIIDLCETYFENKK